MWRLAIAAVAAAAFIQPISAQTRYESGRLVYAMVEAVPEYCPEVERRWGVLNLISDTYGYGPPTDVAELQRLHAEKRRLFRSFRQLPRVTACDMLIREYGPGGEVELFQFR